jgi:cyclophilin family peptidyl-prolyl cis-trans isomerase
VGKRQRIRKERKEALAEEVKAEITRRYMEDTLPFRRTVWWLSTSVIVFVVGGILTLSMPRITNAVSPNLIGPYGTLAKKDFNEANFATLKTDAGDIKIELDHSKKLTAANFIKLAHDNFYNGTKFHRVVNGFMIQGGDPNSKDADPANDGQGGPDYTFADELSGTENYLRGTVAMANAGPNTNGSQFFIVQQDQTGLDKAYTIFGKVVSGMDVVDKIATSEVVDDGRGNKERPVSPVTINAVSLSKE